MEREAMIRDAESLVFIKISLLGDQSLRVRKIPKDRLHLAARRRTSAMSRRTTASEAPLLNGRLDRVVGRHILQVGIALRLC
jgi:hypothetical protein